MSKSVTLARVCALAVASMGGLVLLGWTIQNNTLIHLVTGLAPMVVNTATSFLFTGLAFFLITYPDQKLLRNIAVGMLMLVSILALLTLLEYTFQINLGIDIAPIKNTAGPNPYLGRMSVLTSLNFFIVSKCLLADALGWKDKKWVAQYIMLLALFVALLALASILFGAVHYYSDLTTMALHTTLGFLVLCIGYFAFHAKEGIGALILSKSLAGLLIRSILIPLGIIYPILSFVRLSGEKAGFYNAEGGTVFMMVAGLGLFTIIALIAAQMVSRLDREKEQYKKFFELSSEMLVIAGTDGYIKLTSSAFTKILGYSEEEVSVSTFFAFIHPDDHSKAEVELVKLGSGVSISAFPLRLKTKTGLVKHFLWSVTPDKTTGDLFAAGYDITEIKEAEQVRALAEKLSTQNKQLADFAHIVSHNLRSPVGNLTALLELYRLATPEEREGLFDKFGRVADHLSNTLNDLVESLRIKDGITKDSEPLRFADVLNKTKEILTGQIMESGATITHNFNRQPEVEYPRIYLESIFLNLLSNAIKYRMQNRPLTVHFETLEVNKNLVMTVEDNGQGIDLVRNGEKLFGFYKAFHKSKDSKGMGLFLTKTQIEAMGGSISAQSEIGKGTTFTIIFGRTGVD
jgi:PAS domain S-box-containing protein